jgi:hypothetical protein
MNFNDAVIAKAYGEAIQSTNAALSRFGQGEITNFLGALYAAQERKAENGDVRTMVGHIDVTPDLKRFEQGPMARMNALARALRKEPFMKEFPRHSELVKSDAALMKADLDVGALTNLAQVTGGQALGWVSMDTRMARGTIRPGSFTLYQMLKKTRANQIVDYWPSATATGGALPGSAFNSYGSVNNGALATNAGTYNMNFITLKLALDGRAITMALAAQNSFVNVAEQENTNAALSVLSSIDWACYWGNPNIWANQPQGLYQAIVSGAPSKNIMDFQQYATAMAGQGFTQEQLLFKLIFQQSAEMVGYRVFGIPTHAFMGPGTAGDLQSIPVTILNQIVNGTNRIADHNALIVNGNLQGMNTRFGDIHFPVDLLITSRDTPAQAMSDPGMTGTYAVSTSTPPTSVTVAVSGLNAKSDWYGAYVTTGSGSVTYAVAATDSLMQETNLVYSAEATGIAAGGAYVVTITPANDTTVVAFRVFRSGNGYTQGTNSVPSAFRHIGDIAVPSGNGVTPVVFVDLNTKIPGSETIFILDLDEQDDAFDYRYLMPLSKIDLFAQNIFMPWAVACIGAPRVRIAKFHGMITNYPAMKSDFNALIPNN